MAVKEQVGRYAIKLSLPQDLSFMTQSGIFVFVGKSHMRRTQRQKRRRVLVTSSLVCCLLEVLA